MATQAFIEEFAGYVRKYAPMYGIKVHSPIIAQGILESAKGTTNKVKVVIDGVTEWRHNYLGLKWRDGRCAISNDYFEEWTTEQRTDGTKYDKVDTFYKFKSMEDCVHGYFQWTNIPNYANLKGVTDPETYLQNIKADGYATDLDYVQNVMAVIERYNLTQYDNEVTEEMAKMKICIDAGHFGKKYNRSPANGEYYESEVMWKLHLLQKKYLEGYGFEVILTRAKQNMDLALQTRGKKAEGCVLFISDHSNAVNANVNESIDYVAVYHLTSDSTTNCDDISKSIAEKLAPVIANVMGTKQGYKVLTRKAGSDRNGDGIMNDNYYGVLHGARLVNVPALILEHSFHTNTRSTNWLLNDANLDLLARAEADAIAEYFGMTKETEPDKTVADTLYRVQAGAFKSKSNAENHLAKIKASGFDTYMVQADGFYKIQIGAYSKKANADAMLTKVQKAGFGAYITDKGGQGVAEIVKKSNQEIAKEVLAGKWGNGTARKTALEKAGYNYSEIQKLVNALK